MDDPILARLAGHDATRSLRIADIEVERGGDGRTVTAYAAPFDRLTEVRDQYGHYLERIARGAFNRTINAGLRGIVVLYNHGKDLDGNPKAEFAVPIGVPIEVKPDGKGLLTRTRYIRSSVADVVLDAIKDGAINDYSHRSGMVGPRQVGTSDRGLPIIEHTELRLREFGPTPHPMATVGAEILAVRSASLARRIAELDADALDDATAAELAAILDRVNPGTSHEDPAQGTPSTTPPPTTTDTGTASVEEPEHETPKRVELDPAIVARQRRRRAGS